MGFVLQPVISGAMVCPLLIRPSRSTALSSGSARRLLSFLRSSFGSTRFAFGIGAVPGEHLAYSRRRAFIQLCGVHNASLYSFLGAFRPCYRRAFVIA